MVPDAMVPGSSVLILAQNPGEYEDSGARLVRHEWYNNTRQAVTEATTPQPLIGPTGQWLQEEFWPLTGLDYAGISKANVIKCRPNGVNDLPNLTAKVAVRGISPTMLKVAMEHCTAAYLHIPASVKYVLAMGNISLYHLTREKSITDWRGWVLGRDISNTIQGTTDYYHPQPQDIKIFPMLHIAALYQNAKYYHATLLDFVKFGRLVRGEWPMPLPSIQTTLPKVLPTTIGFDTEYTPENRLLMYSIADVEGNVYAIDGYTLPSAILSPHTTVVTQNGLVDLPHFIQLFGKVNITLEDCMLAHATLWPGEPNDLDYMTSKYGRYNRHKHLRTHEDINIRYLYAGLDADTTLNHVWRGLLAQFEKDRLSWNEYKQRRQPLLAIINTFQTRGIRVDTARVAGIAALLSTRLDEITAQACAITQDPTFNIASNSQVSQALYSGVSQSSKRKTVRKRNTTDLDQNDIIKDSEC